jgi:carbonic anhydrase
MDILRPGYDRIKELPEDEQVGALEQEAVLVSIENLMTFPFVRSAVEAGELSLHGLVHDISEGTLMQAEDAGKKWVPV